MRNIDENRIVLINGNDSEWYEQAIFILRSPGAAKAKNLVKEAEIIINDYMLTGKASHRYARLEEYKKRIAERAAHMETSAQAEMPTAASQPAKRKKKRKTDVTSLLINICLVLASILLGYIMSRVMLP